MGFLDFLFGVRYIPGNVLKELPLVDSKGAVCENIWTVNAKGVTYIHDNSNPQKLIPKLSLNEVVQLVPDPNNSFDNTAIKIETHDGRYIGWYPSKEYHSKDLFLRLCNGEEICALVNDKGIIKSKGVWWFEIKVVIYKQEVTK